MKIKQLDLYSFVAIGDAVIINKKLLIRQTILDLLQISNIMYHIQHPIHSFLGNKCENVILLPAILFKSLKLDL